MLKQRKNIFWLECKKFIFFLVIIFLWFYFPILFLVIIVYISYKKKEENLKSMWVWDFLRFLWLYWCINSNLSKNEEVDYKKIFWDLKTKVKDYNNDNLLWSIKESYKKQINKNNNIYDEDTKSLDDVLWEKQENILKNDNSIKKYNIYDDKELNKILSDKENKFDYSDIEKVWNIKNKTKFSNKYNSFNNGKSIWDDYESVLDIMDNKK